MMGGGWRPPSPRRRRRRRRPRRRPGILSTRRITPKSRIEAREDADPPLLAETGRMMKIEFDYTVTTEKPYEEAVAAVIAKAEEQGAQDTARARRGADDQIERV